MNNKVRSIITGTLLVLGFILLFSIGSLEPQPFIDYLLEFVLRISFALGCFWIASVIDTELFTKSNTKKHN